MDLGLKGKVVLITGASSGIGAQAAVHFAREKSVLVLTGRNENNLLSTAKRCQEICGTAPVTVTGDISDDKFIPRLIEAVKAKCGRLDVLVNNAGVLETGNIETTTLEQYDRVFDVNVRAVYHLTMLAVPLLVETKGCVVNVSSVNGMRSFAGVLAYCMSKSALDQFTRCTALELAPKQVRVNSVNPGVIVTPLQRRGGMSDADYEKFLEHSKSTHALGRPGTTDEAADAIVFLASSRASFITGATLPVDGGRHAMCPR